MHFKGKAKMAEQKTSNKRSLHKLCMCSRERPAKPEKKTKEINSHIMQRKATHTLINATHKWCEYELVVFRVTHWLQ